MIGVRQGFRLALETSLMLGLACQPVESSQNSADHGRWAAQISSDGRSYFTDEPNCHPSDYFEHNAQRLIYEESPDFKKQDFVQDTFMARRIGEISGHTISQYDHLIKLNGQPEFTVKILLFERAPKELCEIYHQEWWTSQVDVQPAYLVNTSSEVILATTDTFRKGGWPLESYWTFDADGPINLEAADKIDEIQKRLLPKNAVVRKGRGFDVNKLAYRADVWKAEDRDCCPTGGHLEIRFALKKHQLVVLSEHFGSK